MSRKKINRLLFIFDAKAGKWSAFVDSTKKLLMIKGCALCTITHGLLGEKAEWKDCKAELGVPIDYIHKDEVYGEIKGVVGVESSRPLLPCIVAEADGEFTILITPEVLERCGGSIPDLKGKIHYYAEAKGLEMPLVNSELKTPRFNSTKPEVRDFIETPGGPR